MIIVRYLSLLIHREGISPIATNTTMKIILTDEQTKGYQECMSEEGRVFNSGKIRVGWTQTRGGYAIFVSGRMEGQLFSTQQDAIDYLSETHNIEI